MRETALPVTADQARTLRAKFDAGEPYVFIVRGEHGDAPWPWSVLNNHCVILESGEHRIARAGVQVVPVVDGMLAPPIDRARIEITPGGAELWSWNDRLPWFTHQDIDVDAEPGDFGVVLRATRIG